MVKCERCGKSVPAVRNAAGKVIALPHGRDGKPVKWPDVCGRRA